MELAEGIFVGLAAMLVLLTASAVYAIYSKSTTFGAASKVAPENTRPSAERMSSRDVKLRKRHIESNRQIDLTKVEEGQQSLSLDTLGRRLDEVGIVCDELKNANDRDLLAFRISRLRSWRAIVFQASIDDMNNVELISSPQDVTLAHDELTPDLLRAMLELNSSNKVGSIGLQQLPHETYRLWVDEYIETDGRLPSAGSIGFIIDAVIATYNELAAIANKYRIELPAVDHPIQTSHRAQAG